MRPIQGIHGVFRCQYAGKGRGSGSRPAIGANPHECDRDAATATSLPHGRLLSIINPQHFSRFITLGILLVALQRVEVRLGIAPSNWVGLSRAFCT